MKYTIRKTNSKHYFYIAEDGKVISELMHTTDLLKLKHEINETVPKRKKPLKGD